MIEKSQLIATFQSHIPFAALLAKGEVESRPLLTRIIEGIMIAAIGGAASAYIALVNFQASTTVQLEDLKAEVAQQHRDTLAEIEQLQYELADQRAYQRQINPGPPPHGS